MRVLSNWRVKILLIVGVLLFALVIEAVVFLAFAISSDHDRGASRLPEGLGAMFTLMTSTQYSEM